MEEEEDRVRNKISFSGPTQTRSDANDWISNSFGGNFKKTLEIGIMTQYEKIAISLR